MYQFKVSTRKNKKYDVYKNNKYIISFGDKNYEHFEDRTPNNFYWSLNHYDEKRRQNYYKRFGNSPAYESAMYFSHKYLW